MMLCILIPLLTGLICAYLGYLLGKVGSDNSGQDNTSYLARIKALETDLEHCRKNKMSTSKISGSENMNVSSFASSSAAVALIPFNGDLAKSVFGKKIKENDLTVVEGIGPKISELFNQGGVHTWKELSECSVDKCQQVLNSGGKRFEIHKPGTWPEQASLAYQGKWQELKDWQDKLDGGK